MKSFEYIILFFSFIFTLALTHLLFAATRMIRHRRSVIFSLEHALWMANAVMLLLGNWLSLFDFRGMEAIRLSTIAMLFAFVIALYFASALASPDFDDLEDYDLKAFHRREGRTYIGAMAVLLLMSLAANIDASRSGVGSWGSENNIVLVMLPTVILPLFFRNRIIQLVCPMLFLALNIAFMVIYYPQLV